MSPTSSPIRGRAATVRLGTWLSRLDQWAARMDGWLLRFLPHDWNPLSNSGRAANLALLVALISGILLLFWYQPSVELAYSSLQAIEGRTLGGWVRALHRYSSDLTVLLIVIHATRTLLACKFAGAHWLAWVSGVLLLALIWFIGWTGYWLVWDQPAQMVAMTSMRFLDALPIFPQPLESLHLADRLIPSLLFFVVFFLHMLLPLLIAAGLVIHVIKLSHVRFFPKWGLTTSLLLGMALASWLVPAPLDEPAHMDVVPESLTVDAWYLTPLALGLRYQDSGLWLVIALVMGSGIAVPWLLGLRRRVNAGDDTSKPADVVGLQQTEVTPHRCDACTQCVQDCPYDAIRMVERGSSRLPHTTVAWVDPERCVGCAVCVGSCHSAAMNLRGLDTLTEEGNILDYLKAHPSDRVALVAEDSMGADRERSLQAWSNALPGWWVHRIPTASWLRTPFLQRIVRRGTARIAVITDGRAESPARMGNQWLEQRVQSLREPTVNPAIAQGISVLSGTPGQERYVARKLNSSKGRGSRESRERSWHWIAASLITTALLLTLSVAPSHLVVSNPANPAPEFVFSFMAYGASETAASIPVPDDLSKPIHMRGQVTQKPRRSAVRVQVELGVETHEQQFEPRGVGRDGPSNGTLRFRVEHGVIPVVVTIHPGGEEAPLVWQGTFEARQRRIQVLTYHPREGFILEPAKRD
jgi:ferredoxin